MLLALYKTLLTFITLFLFFAGVPKAAKALLKENIVV